MPKYKVDMVARVIVSEIDTGDEDEAFRVACRQVECMCDLEVYRYDIEEVE